MSAVVRKFDGVKEAVVTINPGEDHRYVLDKDNVVEATESVALTMMGRQKLTNVAGIRNPQFSCPFCEGAENRFRQHRK